MKPNFDKTNGLIPVIIQHQTTLQVLMLGYMNVEAFEKTNNDQKVWFFSRSKNRLWMKGESSGNVLYVKDIKIDCDQDTLLILVQPHAEVCHTGSFSCFGPKTEKAFIYELEQVISQRIDDKISDSYTYKLYQKGINKVVQKVGEEAVELVIEAKDNSKELFLNEAADLMYHYLILLKVKGYRMQEVESVLYERSLK